MSPGPSTPRTPKCTCHLPPPHVQFQAPGFPFWQWATLTPAAPWSPVSPSVLQQQPKGILKSIDLASVRARPIQQLPGALRISQVTRPPSVATWSLSSSSGSPPRLQVSLGLPSSNQKVWPTRQATWPPSTCLVLLAHPAHSWVHCPASSRAPWRRGLCLPVPHPKVQTRGLANICKGMHHFGILK